MQVDEAVLWERLAHSRRAPVEPNWLGEIYSPSLSVDLRRALCEKLGMLAERGWPVIDQLVQRHGVQPDLVMAAGLCHQTEARDWLLTLLQPTADNAMFNLCVVEALGCWGADVPEDVVIGCLQHPGQHQRLAGLQLLSFRAHCLNDGELLNLCQEALDDFRDPIVVAAIRLLQRRDGDAISARLAELCRTGSMAVADAALRALGCIATPTSQRHLLELSQALQDDDRRQKACRQLSQQFRH
ncbi:MAG: capsid protein [Cyanobium sp. MED843]|nr:capsid protein [Cyanobium sp. MED843]OUW29166.1 MAG: capsid protein [Cyanobacteria bacterium TMED177]